MEQPSALVDSPLSQHCDPIAPALTHHSPNVSVIHCPKVVAKGLFGSSHCDSPSVRRFCRYVGAGQYSPESLQLYWMS